MAHDSWNTSKSATKVYASYAPASHNMLAIWLGSTPDGRDPDGWATGADGSALCIERLAELARAPFPIRIIKLDDSAARIWEAEDRKRRGAARRKAREAHAKAQTSILIPEDVERLGRDAAFARSVRR